MATGSETLRSAVEEAAEVAKGIILEQGHLPPAVLVMAEGMEMKEIIPMPLYDTTLRRIVREQEPDALIVVTTQDVAAPAEESCWQHVVTLAGVSPLARHSLRLVYRREGPNLVFEGQLEGDAGGSGGMLTRGLWDFVN